MPSRTRRLLILAAVAVLPLATASPALAAAPCVAGVCPVVNPHLIQHVLANCFFQYGSIKVGSTCS